MRSLFLPPDQKPPPDRAVAMNAAEAYFVSTGLEALLKDADCRGAEIAPEFRSALNEFLTALKELK